MAHETWNMQSIGEGLEKLISTMGRMPTATEIDAYEGLPSARQMQRRFGGIMAVRKQLGYKEIRLDNGMVRSEVAREIGLRGLALENMVYQELKERFSDVCVHQQRPVGSTKLRLDFYVFSPSGNFGVDVFTAKNINSLKTNMRYKKRRYSSFRGKLYLVYDCPTTVEKTIDGAVVLLSLAEFLEEVKQYKRYELQGTY